MTFFLLIVVSTIPHHIALYNLCVILSEFNCGFDRKLHMQFLLSWLFSLQELLSILYIHPNLNSHDNSSMWTSLLYPENSDTSFNLKSIKMCTRQFTIFCIEHYYFSVQYYAFLILFGRLVTSDFKYNCSILGHS